MFKRKKARLWSWSRVRINYYGSWGVLQQKFKIKFDICIFGRKKSKNLWKRFEDLFPKLQSNEKQCSGSVTFWYGSGSEDPYSWLTDPDADPGIQQKYGSYGSGTLLYETVLSSIKNILHGMICTAIGNDTYTWKLFLEHSEIFLVLAWQLF